MLPPLYSAPNEHYEVHISRCLEKFDLVFPRFEKSAKRILSVVSDDDTFKSAFVQMIRFHDLGKLTKQWQNNLSSKNKKLPSHATVGAAFLYKSLPVGLREPLSFAVAIHHTDRGLLGDNIEKPDVQAILENISDTSGHIIWHEAVTELSPEFFPMKKEIEELNVYSLKNMARGLRIWARGCNLLEQHRRRLQAALSHHILKICDVSAATERKEYEKQSDQDYFGGWLMVENIRDYVEKLRTKPLRG
ncbi:MAG TPA: CRISPR-associated endonuclease Cas3'' [Candidatus Saccharicenans sp.]|nr:CRISPR-associated endonuclease Cas3'' [Candidatus Saccharicenans sp.]